MGRLRVRGLTLIETLLALIMLSLLIVGVLGLLANLLVASTKSTDMTGGTVAAQYLFEEAAVNGPPMPNEAEELVQEGVHQLYSHEEHRPVNFRYRTVWTLIGDSESYFLAGNKTKTQFGPELYHVEIVVWWMVENPEDGRAEGGGKRTLTLERLIKIESGQQSSASRT